MFLFALCTLLLLTLLGTPLLFRIPTRQFWASLHFLHSHARTSTGGLQNNYCCCIHIYIHGFCFEELCHHPQAHSITRQNSMFSGCPWFAYHHLYIPISCAHYLLCISWCAHHHSVICTSCAHHHLGSPWCAHLHLCISSEHPLSYCVLLCTPFFFLSPRSALHFCFVARYVIVAHLALGTSIILHSALHPIFFSLPLFCCSALR